MAVQVSYPGVYIEEFTPGAPIEGVGTSTAAFIGTARRGPIKAPTLIESWDAFETIFGGFIGEQPRSYLAPAVFGFFLNGGTICYIVRVANGAQAQVELTARGSTTDAALIATAIEEGTGGNSIEVQVTESSRLATHLAAAGSTDSVLKPVLKTADITNFDADDTRTTLTVDDNDGFVASDRVLLTKGSENEIGVIASTQGEDTIILNAPVPGTHDFKDGSLRSADLAPGQRKLRLTIPASLNLLRALPRGATVSITLGAATEIAIVASSGGDIITLEKGLSNGYSLADSADLPEIASMEFDLDVRNPVEGSSEKFSGLGMHPNHPTYWANAVKSTQITLAEPNMPPDSLPDDPRPVDKTYNLAGGQPDDRAAALGQLRANPNEYLDLLQPIDEIAIVAIPGETDVVVQQSTRDHCESTYDRFAILDSLLDADSQSVRDQLAGVRSDKGFAAIYYPWITIRNPLTGQNELAPPSGHIAGIYARTDTERGVHKAPANTNIRGALGVERRMTDTQQGPLNLDGVNVIRVFPGRSQPVVWGARTTATTIDNNWQYVNIRRLFLFLEESIQEGIRWAVFEPNNLQLWQKLKRTITEFLTRVWRDGALFGETAEDAFYVRIDEVLNPDSVRALGRLYIEIGVRPSYPAEFIIVRIGIWQGGYELSES